MKRWAIGSIAFFVTLCIGTIIALFFTFDQARIEPIVEQDELREVVVTEAPPTKLELELIDDVNGWPGTTYPFKIKLLHTGEGFHGDEVEAKNGEKWLGLFDDGGVYKLRRVSLKISRVFDDIYDYPNTKLKTGKSVSTPELSKPVFLLKNANLSTGEVPTFFLGKTWDDLDEPQFESLTPDQILTNLNESFSQSYEAGNEKYELKVIRAQNCDEHEILALVLQGRYKRQVLHTMRVDANADLGTLYWVGDLDLEGTPDFYLELFEHYNVGNRVLFLSSRARKGRLVEKVAYFWTTGC